MAIANFNPHIVKVTNESSAAWDWRGKEYVEHIKV